MASRNLHLSVSSRGSSTHNLPIYDTLQITSPPSPALNASHPSIYLSAFVLPSLLSSGVLTMRISPIPTPGTFLALFPTNNLPSSSLLTTTLKLGFETRFILLNTGCPSRCFSPIQSFFAGIGSVLNDAGSGPAGEPREMFDTRPERRRMLEIARAEFV